MKTSGCDRNQIKFINGGITGQNQRGPDFGGHAEVRHSDVTRIEGARERNQNKNGENTRPHPGLLPREKE